MRQIALAQYLLGKYHDVTLFASITGPDWLRKYVESQSGLVWVEVGEGDFSADPLLAGDGFDILVVDAYTLSQNSLDLLQETTPTVAVVIDGPWQDLRGELAIAPTLDRNPLWAHGYRKRFDQFHWGPEFFMLRSEVIALAKRHSKRLINLHPRIVVALGGSDLGGKTVQIVERIASIFTSAEIDAYVPGAVSSGSQKNRTAGRVTFHPSGPEFIGNLALADVAVVGAGTTVAEVLFIQTPAIFVVVAENQMANHVFLTNADIGQSLVLESDTFEKDLSDLLRVRLEALSAGVSGPNQRTPLSLDGRGVERVARLITAPVRRRSDNLPEVAAKMTRNKGGSTEC